MDLDQPFLECDEYSDSESEDGYSDNSPEATPRSGHKGSEIDILDDMDLYADSPSDGNPIADQSHALQQKETTQVKSASRPSSSRLSSNHHKHHHEKSIISSPGIEKSIHPSTYDAKVPVPTYIPPSSSAGFSSYEEYVAARKKGGEVNSNPYTVPQAVEEENPYSSYTEDPSAALEPSSSDHGDSVYVPYTPSSPYDPTSNQPYIPSGSEPYVPS